jgi:HEAT repeat protein
VAFSLDGRHRDIARRTLIQLSADPDAEVRDWATFALGAWLDDDASVDDALAARLDDPDEETRGEAIHGLARRNDPRVIPALIAALAVNPDAVSYLALDAVAQTSGALTEDLLATVSRHPDGARIRWQIESYRRDSSC